MSFNAKDMTQGGQIASMRIDEAISREQLIPLDREAGLVMTVLTVGLVSCTGKSLPRFWYGDFFPTFYACHLTVLGVLAV